MRLSLDSFKISNKSVACSITPCLIAILTLFIAVSGRAQRVGLVPHSATIDVQINGKPFTTYHFNDDYFHSPVRPFLYPVVASDGTEVTTDQEQTDPAHGYQRSIWIGHADVNGTNHWKFTQPLARQKHVRFDWFRRDAFKEQLVWTDKDGAPMIRETRTLRFHAYRDGVRSIEFRMAMTPAAGDVTFGTRGDHGLLSVRGVESLYHAPVFTAPDGSNTCEVPPLPKHAAIAAANLRPEVHMAWCDESGEINGKTYGIAIFDHPSNPRHPPMWHAHPDARLATDMFALDKTATGDRRQGSFTIRAGTTVTFRYEVVIHDGPAALADLRAMYASFARSK